MRLASIFVGLFAASLCGAQPASLSGIAHVAFRVADLEVTRAFYNKLGYDQFFETKRGDQTTEAFLKINDHQFLELYPRTAPAQPLGLMHVCYESNDIEALHEEYVKRGIAVSGLTKGAAGNFMMNTKEPEGQTIEFTQYMPGSRHFEDRGKHLGAKRVAQVLVGATSTSTDVPMIRTYYMEKLAFSEIKNGSPVRLRLPGDSGQELDIAGGGEGKAGIQFGVADLKQTAALLASLGLAVKATPVGNPTLLTVADPDGVVVSFVVK